MPLPKDYTQTMTYGNYANEKENPNKPLGGKLKDNFDNISASNPSVFEIGCVEDERKMKIKEVTEKLKKMNFVVLKPGDFEKYLVDHADLIQILYPVCQKVKREFSSVKKFFVSAFQDIEDPSDSYLLIGLKTNGFNPEIFDKIIEIYDDPVMDFPKNTNDWIQIEMDY